MWKDSETELDFLDFDYLINILKDIIADETLLPSSVGVYGDWGSGKSSLISMSMKSFEDDKDTICMVFNGWLFEGYEDAKTALMGSILDTIQQKTKLSEKALKCIKGLYKSVDKLKLLKNGLKYGADFFLTGGIGTVADITLNNVISKVKEKSEDLETESIIEGMKDELSNKEIREDIKEFQKNFSVLLKETSIKRLVIFIDELDRCSPETILETLEAIRLFLFTGNSIFIVGADERHISYAVKRKFDKIEGHQIDIGKEYLEKIIQYPIRIPRLNSKEVELYITCLLFEKDLTNDEFKEMMNFINAEKRSNFLNFSIDYSVLSASLPELAEKVKDSLSVAKQLSSVLANGLNGNPRHCKRFLNSLVMREKMAWYKDVQLDRKILAKIMMLEYFKSPLFRQIAQLASSEQGKPQELKLLESKQLTESNELKLWKDDAWVQDWCNIDPYLSDIDLMPYFYFSRSSLDERFDTSVVKLSPKAQKVLGKLLSKTRTGTTEALQMSTEINDSESGEILQAVFTKIVSDTSIDTDNFKAFLDWGKTKEILYSNVLSNLTGLSGERLTPALIKLVKDFMDKSNKQLEVLEITERWSVENTSLSAMIQREFRR
ncbi:KAP family P-loop NTPase fold protein [Paenibacillus donghaensis]|uniref:NTPase n=1 Tax=Paenibacillus donghaensis TaxID=414771 RepID=A0A2Z2KJD2_9BACL|nr:P-loop NTPase fold protein [Paenibacillus donghaensis]ASA23373.1 NTPase [Paenibacillus donghaensis]